MGTSHRWKPLTAMARAAGLLVILLLTAARAWAADVSLAWDPVVDPNLSGYMVYYGPAAGNYPNKIDVGNSTTATVANLTDGATYYFAVTAYDGARIESGFSNEVSRTILHSVPVASFTASTTSGVAPLALNFINTSTGNITSYAWTFGDGTTSTVASPAKVYSVPGNYTVSLTVTGPGGSNTQTRANFITVAASSDMSPPTTPSGLIATASATTTVNLAWTASTDNVGVTGYRVERCQGATCSNYAQIATATGTTYSNTGLTAATTYRYRVRANDAAGNLSAYSPVATATTAAAADTSPPTPPSSLTATASGTGTVNLAWSASTDNVGVTGYQIERCQGSSCTDFGEVGIASGTTYTNTGLLAGTNYRYRVRAADAAGNLSAYSNVAGATTGNLGSAPINFVQLNYAVPQSPQSTVPVTFAQAQTAGNLNVVVVGWNDTSASVSSVTDSNGNVYTRAIGPTKVRGNLSQSIYYAKNIAAATAGANTLTVKFNVPAVYPDIRIVEYSGLDKVKPVTATAAGSGVGVLAKSASAKTRNANNLLFGANTVTGGTLGAGAGYTTRIITSPNGDIAQDRVVTSTGSYSATAPLDGGSWVIQLVAFKAAP
jgi:PKD repeat protein